MDNKLIIKEIATWLANVEGEGASDEEFAETLILAQKMRQTQNKDTVLTADDMNNADTADISGHIKDCLDEILFSEEMDSSCWWKAKEPEKRKKRYKARATMTTYAYAIIEAENEADALQMAEELDGGEYITDDDDGDWEVNIVGMEE